MVDAFLRFKQHACAKHAAPERWARVEAWPDYSERGYV